MSEAIVDIDTLFANAIELKTDQERRSFLESRCADDAIRAKVQKLVDAHFQADQFLDSPAPQVADLLTMEQGEPRTNDLGAVIGPYRLLEQIGEGGMGIVYMAQQSTPVRRAVAIKIMKPGLDSTQVLGRFEAERQALALMDHPNIAKVFDAGATDSGRPYFVMELVKGVSLTKFCDERRLTPRERLELFIPVCHAIQHAHQKAIIHRDLKPSNVLVALYDDKPVPKVIDFGVAKALGSRLTDRTMFTGFGAIIGTIQYMSPEQAVLNQLDVDTRSDIYSLGVLLYELLTGSTPVDKERLGKSALDEVLRIIREEEPPKPSTRLTRSAELRALASQRGVEPRKLSGTVKGELDWIVMKALEKDRNRRYDTANALAHDISSYLRDEPVLACPPTSWYRLSKFARRNRASIAVAAAVAILLVGAVTVLAISSVLLQRHGKREAAARELAEANFALARDATDQMLLRAADELAGVPQREEARRALLRDATSFYQNFLRQKGNDPKTREGAAHAYLRLAELNGLLGQHEEAVKASRESVEILKKLTVDFPNQPNYLIKLGESEQELGSVLLIARRPSEARAALGEAMNLREKLASAAPNDPQRQADLARTEVDLSLALPREQCVEAEQLARRAQARARKLMEASSSDPKSIATAAEITNTVGALQQDLKHYEDALASYQDAAALQEAYIKRITPTPQDRTALALIYGNIAKVSVITSHDDRQLKEGTLALRQLNAPGLDKLSTDFPQVPGYREQVIENATGMGNLLWNSAHVSDAEAAYRKAITLQEQLVKEFPATNRYRQGLADLYLNLANLMRYTWRSDQAQELLTKAIALKEQLAVDDPGQQDQLKSLRFYLSDVAKKREAQGLIVLGKSSPAGVAQAIARASTLDPDRADMNAFSLLICGEYMTLGGQPKRGAAAIERAIATAGDDMYQEFKSSANKSLGWALAAAGDPHGSEDAFSKAAAPRERWTGDLASTVDPDALTAAYFLNWVDQDRYVNWFQNRVLHATQFKCFPWFYIGQRREIEGKRSEAIEAYRKCVQLGSGPLSHQTANWAAYRLHVLTGSELPSTRPATNAVGSASANRPLQ